MADSAKSVGAGGLERFEDGFDGGAKQKIGVSHYRGGGARRTVQVTLAGGGESLNELDFADRAHLFRAAGAVHGAGLDEHGGADVVSAVHVVG